MSLLLTLNDITNTTRTCPDWCATEIHYEWDLSDAEPMFHSADIGAAAGVHVFVTMERTQNGGSVFVDIDWEKFGSLRLSPDQFVIAARELTALIDQAERFALQLSDEVEAANV